MKEKLFDRSEAVEAFIPKIRIIGPEPLGKGIGNVILLCIAFIQIDPCLHDCHVLRKASLKKYKKQKNIPILKKCRLLLL